MAIATIEDDEVAEPGETERPVERATATYPRPIRTVRPILTRPSRATLTLRDTEGPAISEFVVSPDTVFQSVDNCPAAATTLDVRVNVSDPSGVARVRALFRFRGGGEVGEFHELPLEPGVQGNDYFGVVDVADDWPIGLVGPSGDVEVYIEATDSRGNSSQSRPLAAKVSYCIG
jgi:hypothetical protein